MSEFTPQRKKQSDTTKADAVHQRQSAAVLQDNRPSPVQAKAAPTPNRTGMPDTLKSGIESLSGMSMDHVKVHYNSDKPAQLHAHAYAQGSDIHLAPGQEKHLPHEAWHVVQQAQGRVMPTVQMKGGANVNDDAGLEREADVMGARADAPHIASENNYSQNAKVVEHVGSIQRKITSDGAPLSLKQVRKDLEARLKTSSLSKKKKEERLQAMLQWAEKFEENSLDVDILTLLNGKSYESILSGLEKKASIMDRELGKDAHAFTRHSAITIDGMNDRIKGRTTSATKFVDVSAYETLVLDFKEKVSALTEWLEFMGAQLCELKRDNLEGKALGDQVKVLFSKDHNFGGYKWKDRGKPETRGVAGGDLVIISWVAESEAKYKKIKVGGDGFSEKVSEPVKAYAGENLVSIKFDINRFVVEGVGSEIKFHTLF